VKENSIYKAHRIHIMPLFSGRWISSIVSMGKEKVITKNSLTAAVTRVPGEYDSEGDALQAARQYIDGERDT
jgi:hypothetical protein